MNGSTGGPDVHLLVGAYAVDALDTAEADEFESHLDGCESCRRELAGLRATTAELGAAVGQTPPAALRAKVLAAVAATAQLPPESRLAPSVTAVPGSENAPADDSEIVQLRTSRQLGQRLLAAAAAVLLVVAGALGWRVATLSGDLDAAQVAAAQMSEVLTAPDAITVTGSITGGGRGTVVASASLDQAVIVTDALPQPPPGKVYQLWYMTSSGAATPAGFLDPGASGQAALPLSGSMQGADAVGISVEPAGGSTAPTTAPVLALKV